MKEIIEQAINDYPYFSPMKVDKRKRAFKEAKKIGFGEYKILNARITRINRQRVKNFSAQVITFEDKKRFLAEVKRAQFDMSIISSRFNCTGIDWRQFHRPTLNGKGWVLIAPDEPVNNWYMEDLNILHVLSKKYLTKIS